MGQLYKGKPHLNDVQILPCYCGFLLLFFLFSLKGGREGEGGEGEPSIFFREYTVKPKLESCDSRGFFAFL